MFGLDHRPENFARIWIKQHFYQILKGWSMRQSTQRMNIALTIADQCINRDDYPTYHLDPDLGGLGGGVSDWGLLADHLPCPGRYTP